MGLMAKILAAMHNTLRAGAKKSARRGQMIVELHNNYLRKAETMSIHTNASRRRQTSDVPVFIADDNNVDRTILESALRKLGFAVVTFSSGIASEAMGVEVEWKSTKYVLAVKEVLGIQKVVCKPVEGDMLAHGLFDGAAISGTGQVSMIVNIENLLKIQ